MNTPSLKIHKRVVYHLKLYYMYLKIYVRTLVEYRADTWVALVSGLFIQAMSILFINILFQRIPSLSNWNFYEVLFIYSFASMGREFNRVFMDAPFSLHGYIRSYELDTMLVRPAGPLFQVIARSQQINGVGLALVSTGMMVFSAIHLDLTWNVGRVLYFLVALVSSVVIQFSILMSVVTLGFWFLEIRAVVYPVFWLYNFGYYPLNIFHPFVRSLFTFVIPYAFASFYPAAYILRPEDYSWALWAVPAVALLLTTGSYMFWRHGLNNYANI